MSPLSSVDWGIRLGHAAVTVRRRSAGWTRRGWQRSESTVSRAYAPEQGEPALAWQAALAELERALGPGRGLGGAAHVVLADSMVRYALVPWNAVLTGADEEAAFLRHRFGQLYDGETAGWDLRIERPRGERSRLASAVDPALIAALAGLLRQRGIRLRSLVPALADTVNRRLSSLQAPAGWLVSHDAGSLSIARWEDGTWLSARCFRVDSQWRTSLAGLLAREECMHDGRTEAATVYLDDGDGGAPPSLPGWHVLALDATAAPQEEA